MTLWKKMFSLSVVMLIMVIPAKIDAFALTQIDSVKIEVEAEIVPEMEFGDEYIEITVQSGRCEFIEYEILNEDNQWMLNMVPKIEVLLEAEEGYYFPSSLKASKIKVVGGTYVTATRMESNSQLKITLLLPGLLTYIGEMTNISLDQNGVASWQPVVGAAEYSARLYRDGSGVGPYVVTSNTTYNFSQAMLRAGNYLLRIRAINGAEPDNKSESIDSNTVQISEVSAAANKENNTATAGEWREDEIGWWYCHGNNSYTTSGWEKIHGSWYMFDEVGYMRTGWVEFDGNMYYFNPDGGAMVTNMVIEGKQLGEDGAVVQGAAATP